MSRKFFITGTDTNIGKTYVCAQLLNLFNFQGLSTLGIKPIASGDCSYHNGTRVNSDALVLQNASSIKLPYEMINPFCFEPPIAPNIAAQQANISLTVNELNIKTAAALSYPADISLIEGAGGWFTPLNAHELYADYVKYHQLPVILVVGMRLGCINHSILTYRAILNQGLEVAGWIANFPTGNPIAETDEILSTLQNFIQAPLLGLIKYNAAPEIDINKFLL